MWANRTLEGCEAWDGMHVGTQTSAQGRPIEETSMRLVRAVWRLWMLFPSDTPGHTSNQLQYLCSPPAKTGFSQS